MRSVWRSSIWTPEQARQAFNALSGEVHATVSGVLADDSRYVREAVLGRLTQAAYTNGNGQVAALDEIAPERGGRLVFASGGR